MEIWRFSVQLSRRVDNCGLSRRPLTVWIPQQNNYWNKSNYWWWTYRCNQLCKYTVIIFLNEPIRVHRTWTNDSLVAGLNEKPSLKRKLYDGKLLSKHIFQPAHYNNSCWRCWNICCNLSFCIWKSRLGFISSWPHRYHTKYHTAYYKVYYIILNPR